MIPARVGGGRVGEGSLGVEVEEAGEEVGEGVAVLLILERAAVEAGLLVDEGWGNSLSAFLQAELREPLKLISSISVHRAPQSRILSKSA